MSFNKIFLVVTGIAAIALQPVHPASIGGSGGVCMCTLVYDPVCGSDSKTYSNDCEFNCAQQVDSNLKISARGECINVKNLPSDEVQNLPAEIVQNLPAEKVQEMHDCFCTLDYNPVCASNGKTYGSECEFNCAKKLDPSLKIASRGQCVEVNTLPMERVEKIQELNECFCTRDYNPVCGSDRNTYPNECELNCAKRQNPDLRIISRGQCVEVNTLPVERVEKIQGKDECTCNLMFSPVCANDDNTYPNECMFNCAKRHNGDLKIISRGECGQVKNLPVEEVKNLPIEEVQNLPAEVVQNLPAEKVQEMHDCFCTLDYSPVCASNGKTYGSECEFNCAKKLDPSLKIASRGQCVEVNTLPVEHVVKIQDDNNCFCTLVYNPVCGSDGNTYSSDCELNCAKKRNPDLRVISKGQCVEVNTLPVERVEKIQELNECFCTREYNPVCGSDENTYPNECELNCAKRKNPDLRVISRGQCAEVNTLPMERIEKIQELKECICTRDYNPVCGSDKNTYPNECMFNCAKRDNGDLKIISRGECDQVRNLPTESSCKVCTMEYGPICGSDLKTYGNPCLFRCQQRIKTDLTIKHIGEC